MLLEKMNKEQTQQLSLTQGTTYQILQQHFKRITVLQSTSWNRMVTRWIHQLMIPISALHTHKRGSEPKVLTKVKRTCITQQRQSRMEMMEL